jgi:hypothetical protein
MIELRSNLVGSALTGRLTVVRSALIWESSESEGAPEGSVSPIERALIGTHDDETGPGTATVDKALV